MKRPDLEAIEARAKAAAPGPWQRTFNATNRKPSGLTSPNEHSYAMHVRNPPDEQEYIQFYDEGTFEFIEHSRQDIPDLLAYVRQLETLLAKTEEIQNLHRLIESGQATMIEESRDFFAALKLPEKADDPS